MGNAVWCFLFGPRFSLTGALAIKRAISDGRSLAASEELKKVFDSLEDPKAIWTWPTAYDIEVRVFQIRSDVQKRNRLHDLRIEYKLLAGEGTFSEYEKYALKDLETASTAQLTDEFTALLTRYTRAQESTWRIVKWRRNALLVVSIFTFLFFIILTLIGMTAVWKLQTPNSVREPLLLMLMACGILGGFMSFQQRLYRASGDTEFANPFTLESGALGMVVAPLHGAVFSCLMYLLFIGGILKGGLFPNIHTPQIHNVNAVVPSDPTSPKIETITSSEQLNATSRPNQDSTTGNKLVQDNFSLVRFFTETGPDEGKDLALLLLWCFLAGFAERLIPDVLDRLSSKVSVV